LTTIRKIVYLDNGSDEVMFPRVFFVLGIDGSGKSTHGHALRTLFESEGKKVKYVWMRRVAYFSIPLLGISRILGITKVRRFKNGAHWISEYPFYAYRPLKFLWPLLQLVDSTLRATFSITIPLLLDPELTIIVDRGIIDTLVDVTVDIGFTKKSRVIESLYESSIPKNSFIAIFDIDEETAIQRKSDIPSISYLTIRRKLYLNLAKKYKWPIYSTKGNFDEVHNELILEIQRNSVC